MSAISPTILSEQNGTLTAIYRGDNKLDKFSYLPLNNKVEQVFELSKTWVNDNPADNLKTFRSQRLKSNDLIDYKIKEDYLYLSMRIFQEKVTLNVIHCNEEKKIEVSPKLKIRGLREKLQKEWNLKHFAIHDEQKHSGENQTAQEIKGSLSIEIKERQTADKNNDTNTSLEGGRLFFTDFGNPIDLALNLNEDGEAHDWHYIEPGLNLRGECNNKECVACQEGKVVYIRKGLSSEKEPFFFDMSTELVVKCPKCPKELEKVTSCLFWDCVYTITGEITGEKGERKPFKFKGPDGKLTGILSLTVGSEKARYYSDLLNSSSNAMEWRGLRIETKPRPPSIDSNTKNLPPNEHKYVVKSKTEQRDVLVSNGCIII